MDLVKLKTAQIRVNVCYNILSGNVQKMFISREGNYDLRGKLNIKHPTVKYVHLSLWAIPLEWSRCGNKNEQ